MPATNQPQADPEALDQEDRSRESGRTEASFLNEAIELGKFFLDYAQKASDGSPYWLKAVANSQGQRTPLGPHLHAGYSGIALFLAALGKVTGEAPFRDAALQSLGTLRRQLQRMARQPKEFEMKIGAVTGLASLIYTVFRVGAWLDEPALVEDACAAATLLSAEKVAEDKFGDVMYGSAGALLVLLVIDAEAPARQKAELLPLERAIACGEHLLKLKAHSPDGPAGWPSPLQPPGSGFAHGASGIALALGRLAHRTGREELWAAALDGLAFERLHYDPQIDNWLPVRFRPLRILLNAWCNGAAGIALARLGLLQNHPSPEIDRDLQLALASVSSASPANIDTICCGNFGRADILLEASRQLGRADLLSAARLVAAGAVARAEAEAEDRCSGYLTCAPGELTGGFYTGLPGIGYSLLRLAGESGLPCVQAVD